jgi:quercetin dioxygenase-like cupin family protein
MTNLSAGTSGSATDVVVSRAAGTGPATWAMGMLFERLVGAEETAGLLGASVVTQPPGQASPLHVHTREAEAWFLLQGAMTYRAGERLIRMTAGDFIYLPREVPHAFRTTGTGPERPIRLFGDPVLRTSCDAVDKFDDALISLVTDLEETVSAPGRAGLAANQIGVSRRVFAYDRDGQGGHVVNPVIEAIEGEQEDEGPSPSSPDRRRFHEAERVT